MEIVHDPPTSVDESLGRDEALLERGTATVRVSVVRDRGVSFGVGTAPGSPAETAARRLGVPTLRRSTGGSGILHLPGDLHWSVVLPRSDPIVGPDFSSAYGRLGAGVVLFLADLGIDGRWSEPLGLSDDFCLLGRRGRALTVGARVLGGAAQHVTARALLHHGIVARSIDRALVARIFSLSAVAADRSLTSLEEVGATGDPERYAEAIGIAIGAALATPGRS